MIGVDTNVIVRYLTQDDSGQAKRVDGVIASAIEDGERFHVDDIVVCEIAWVLRAAYRLGKPTIASALDKLLSTAIFSFEDRELLRGALVDFTEGPGDFSDYLIGRRNSRAGCENTLTFDRSLRDQPPFRQL